MFLFAMPKYEAAAVRSGKHSPELSSTNWRGGGDSKGLPWASTWHSGWKNPPKGNIAEHKLQYVSSETRLHPCILSDVRESRYHNLQTQTILRQWHSLWENGSAVGALETRDHVLFGVKYSNLRSHHRDSSRHCSGTAHMEYNGTKVNHSAWELSFHMWYISGHVGKNVGLQK